MCIRDRYIVTFGGYKLFGIFVNNKLVTNVFHTTVKALKFNINNPVSYTHLDVYKRQGRLVKPFTFTDMEISGATTNRVVLDIRYSPKP